MTHTLPTLDQVHIASPCHVSWDEMRGDDQVRFCAHCKLNVYNLSEMPRDEAARLVQEREGRLCVRLYRRHDGTVLTRDCPVGLRALRQRLVRSAAALAGLLLAMIGGTALGSRINRALSSNVRRPAHAFANWVQPEPQYAEMGDIVMGSVPPPIACGPPPVPVMQPPTPPLPLPPDQAQP
jgi:hypothetical protein